MHVMAADEVASVEKQLGKSTVIKRSVVLNDHKTSVSLEEPFWIELKSIAAGRKVPLGRLISMIDANRGYSNLSSALRLFVLKHHRDAVEHKQLPTTTRT